MFRTVALSALLAAARSNFFLIDQEHVGKLAIGMAASQIYRLYPDLETRRIDLQLEGNPTPAVQIYLSSRNNRPALVVRLTVPGDRIEAIEVDDSRFRDKAGIHVGSRFGDLRRAHGDLELAVGEGEYWVFSKAAGLSFLLRTNAQTEAALDANGGDLSTIPEGTVIGAILVLETHFKGS